MLSLQIFGAKVLSTNPEEHPQLSAPCRLHLPRRLLDEMIAHAVADLPNECCGLLAGTVGSGQWAVGSGHEPSDALVRVVTQRYPLVNVAGSPTEYLSDAEGMFAAVRDMRQREIDVLAVYHSHPTSEPVPSRTDLQRNYSPDVMNLIISLKSGTPEVRGWWLTSEGYREAEWEISE